MERVFNTRSYPVFKASQFRFQNLMAQADTGMAWPTWSPQRCEIFLPLVDLRILKMLWLSNEVDYCHYVESIIRTLYPMANYWCFCEHCLWPHCPIQLEPVYSVWYEHSVNANNNQERQCQNGAVQDQPSKCPGATGSCGAVWVDFWTPAKKSSGPISAKLNDTIMSLTQMVATLKEEVKNRDQTIQVLQGEVSQLHTKLDDLE